MLCISPSSYKYVPVLCIVGRFDPNFGKLLHYMLICFKINVRIDVLMYVIQDESPYLDKLIDYAIAMYTVMIINISVAFLLLVVRKC